MNRLNTIIIYNNNSALEQWLVDNNITFENTKPCTQLSENVFFIESLTDIQMIDILSTSPEFYQCENYKSKFRLWYDTGSAEIIVKNNEYKNYNINQLYVNKKGTYDPTIE
jgi:hypothetical protein